MVGVTRIGTYLPRRRLDRALMAKAWGTRARGSRTVAAIDEDAFTMGLEALRATAGTDASGIDAVFFASTTAPYVEKQIASMVATVADLPRAVRVADFTGSTRAGLTALRSAFDAVAAGGATRAVAIAADARVAEPESALEAQLGDGAAAVEVASDGVVAELVAAASVAEEFTHFYRTDAQRYVQVADARFGAQYGYAAYVPEAVTAVLRQAEVPPSKIARLAVAAPDARSAAAVAKKIGAAGEGVLVPGLWDDAGVLGTPDPFVLLHAALETAAPGEFVVVAAYGEGADAIVFRVTDAITTARPRPLADALADAIAVPSYERYLRARGILPLDVEGEPFSTHMEWKELQQDARLYGSRCTACGLVQYPQTRVCHGCEAADRMDEHKLAKEGVVFTYTIDNLFQQVPEHPMPMVVADLDGGGRVYLQGTDSAEGEVDVGTRVRLTYRRLHESGGDRNYFWKVRPV